MSTQITQVKWNTDKLKFEEMEGKRVIINNKHYGIYVRFILNNDDYIAAFCEGFVGFSILSDEQQTCEWTKEPVIVTESYRTSCDCYSMPYSTDYKVCPVCTLPIHIVDELKPLPLMGIEPEKEKTGDFTYYIIYLGSGSIIRSVASTNDREAVESWNSLVKKLTGEK